MYTKEYKEKFITKRGEIEKWITEGLTVSDIASKLKISGNCARKYLKNLEFDQLQLAENARLKVKNNNWSYRTNYFQAWKNKGYIHKLW